MPIKTNEEEQKKKAEKSQPETKIETHARNTNPKHKHSPKHKAETQAQLETQSRNISIARNTKSKHKHNSKHKHSSKHKSKMSKIEKRGRNGSGRRRWVYGG